MAGRFVGRFLELMIAMFFGMLLLDPVWAALLPPVARLDVSALIMAVQMALAVAVWMGVRRYSLLAIAEMALAMIGPFLVLLVPFWLGAMSGATVMMAGHMLMLVCMPLAMARRRTEYLRSRPSGRRRWLVRTAVVLVALLVAGGVSAVNTVSVFADLYKARPDAGKIKVAAKTANHDRNKPTIAFLGSDNGTNVADLLAPYEILAGTGRMNTYVVSAGARLLPMTGGLDIVPDLTFDELAQLMSRQRDSVDAVVIPALQKPEPAERTSTNAWLQRQSTAGALMLSVCTGADTLAASGLLDGRPATSHWWRMSRLRDDHPAVQWSNGQRYVDDGNVITTAGVLSGIDGALRIIERLIDSETAREAAERIHWRHYSPGTAAQIPALALEPADAVVALNTSYRPGPTTIGVQLTDGIGEVELASAFVSYTEHAMVGDTVALGDGPIRSRHGLTFVPRSTVTAAAGDLERLLVPGLDAARRQVMGAAQTTITGGLQPEYLHPDEEFAFNPVIRDIARTYDLQTARWTAKTLEFPLADVKLTGSDWPWEAVLTLIRLMLIGALGTLAVTAVIRWMIQRSGNRRVPGPTDGDDASHRAATADTDSVTRVAAGR
ncbi:DJ-1/PfpI family protein [Nonomuraea sp. LPB2021202275-12-8]|uniref:DJ-1/PfpI family protein n=1 Tax=Nonomuraea sp. LPB2021202275-12-8 TaxID=3120159 RepID=UPI00300C23EB